MNRPYILSTSFLLSVLAFAGCKKDNGSVPAPIVSFSATKTTADAGEIISFTNTSSNAKTYAWEFGDGITSNNQNPTHIYKTRGNFVVKLVATGDGGSNNKTIGINVQRSITVFEGKGIKEISLGDSWSKVKAALGKTGYTITIGDQAEDLSYRQDVTYRGIQLTFFTASSTSISENDAVNYIYLNSGYGANTSKGIAISDALSEIVAAYGLPNFYDFSKLYGYSVYEYESEGISFFFSKGLTIIDEMVVYSTYIGSKKSAKNKDFLNYRPFLK